RGSRCWVASRIGGRGKPRPGCKRKRGCTVLVTIDSPGPQRFASISGEQDANCAVVHGVHARKRGPFRRQCPESGIWGISPDEESSSVAQRQMRFRYVAAKEQVIASLQRTRATMQ